MYFVHIKYGAKCIFVGKDLIQESRSISDMSFGGPRNCSRAIPEQQNSTHAGCSCDKGALLCDKGVHQSKTCVGKPAGSLIDMFNPSPCFLHFSYHVDLQPL